jgi:hypothetical protein
MTDIEKIELAQKIVAKLLGKGAQDHHAAGLSVRELINSIAKELSGH